MYIYIFGSIKLFGNWNDNVTNLLDFPSIFAQQAAIVLHIA